MHHKMRHLLQLLRKTDANYTRDSSVSALMHRHKTNYYTAQINWGRNYVKAACSQQENKQVFSLIDRKYVEIFDLRAWTT